MPFLPPNQQRQSIEGKLRAFIEWRRSKSNEERRKESNSGEAVMRYAASCWIMTDRLRDVSYSSFAVRKDDLYTGRGRVAAWVCDTASTAQL